MTRRLDKGNGLTKFKTENGAGINCCNPLGTA